MGVEWEWIASSFQKLFIWRPMIIFPVFIHIKEANTKKTKKE